MPLVEKWAVARTEYMALQDLVEVVNNSLSIHIVVHMFFIFYFVVLLVIDKVSSTVRQLLVATTILTG